MRRPLLVLLLAGLSACGEPPPPPPAAPLPGVRTVPLAAVIEHPLRQAPARVAARRHARLAAEVVGTVAAVPVRAGQRVAAGTPLVKLDCPDVADALAQAEAALDAARVQAERAAAAAARAQRLHDRGALADELLDDRRAAAEAAAAERRAREAAWRRAQRDRARCDVRAPFAGVVLDTPVRVGDRVTPGTALLELLDTDSLQVEAELPASLRASLAGAAAVHFVHRDGRHRLRLASLAEALDARTLTVAARLDFVDPPPPAGTLGRLEWQEPQAMVGPSWLSERDGRLGLLWLDGDTVAFTPLPQALPGRAAAVDLPPDTPLIGDGRHGLAPGDRVRRLD
ncbi:MAG: hypothetical protein KatS3mg121_0930 [Gammaproteobacteria bacterium]|nr:MAG: hypothetical protein KatS3mg121_0930 [Gammaproteobacteria bacterium]